MGSLGTQLLIWAGSVVPKFELHLHSSGLVEAAEVKLTEEANWAPNFEEVVGHF